MNVSFRSRDPGERILSNLAHTPFTIEVNGERFECASVEGFWQGLKCKDAMRLHVFSLSGMAAKRAGRGKGGRHFDLAGQRFTVGSEEHESLIREAIKQKILQTPKANKALRKAPGTSLIASVDPNPSSGWNSC